MIVRRFGAGPELVWIHGLGEWSQSFDVVARRLDGFTHVLPDLPGYGRSPWPAEPPAGDPVDRSLGALADHLAAWLADRPPAVLVGHSLGGVLATLVAERIPVRGIVNADGNLTHGDCTFSLQAVAYSAEDFVAHGFDAIRDDVYRRGLTDAALRGYYPALVAASPRAFHRHAVDLVAASDRETLAGRMTALRAPHLFLAGVPDGICTHSRAVLERHGARWIGIEPAGHWVFVDQPDAFAGAVASFAREIR